MATPAANAGLLFQTKIAINPGMITGKKTTNRAQNNEWGYPIKKNPPVNNKMPT